MDDRVEPAGREGCSRESCYRRGGRVGLLCADAALLDGKLGCVAGGVDALGTGHAAECVDSDEAVFPVRNAPYCRTEQFGKSHHPVDLKVSFAGLDDHFAGAWDLRVCGGDRVDVCSGEQAPDGAARRVSKYGKGAVLGRNDGRLQCDAHVVCAPGRHQGKLVERQRPRDAAGHDERELANVVPLDILDEAVHGLVEVVVVERQRVLIARGDRRAERDHQRVVLE